MSKLFPIIMYAAYISIICIVAISIMSIIEKKKYIMLPGYILMILVVAFKFDGNEKFCIGMYAANVPALFILDSILIIKEKMYLTNGLIQSMVIILSTVGCIQYILYKNIYDVLFVFALYGIFFILNKVLFDIIENFFSNQYIQNKNVICVFINSIFYSIMVHYIKLPIAGWMNQHIEFLKIVISIESVGLFLLIYNSKQITLKMNEVIEQLEYVYKYSELEHIEKMYEEAKKLRHNIKHNIVVAEGFIDSKQYKKAKEYMEELVQTKVDAFGYTRYCDNQVINYIINDKKNKCTQSKIEFKCIVFGKITGVHDIDISVLIGNLLDNAIEATEKTDDKIVNLEIYNRSFVEIIIENSITKSVLKYNPEFLTTKENDELHGYGMKSIKDIICKYKGEITYEETGNMMNCRVVLLKL